MMILYEEEKGLAREEGVGEYKESGLCGKP